ncbi:MAG: hypothetical protein RH860_09465 [Cytophagales bacterium]
MKNLKFLLLLFTQILIIGYFSNGVFAQNVKFDAQVQFLGSQQIFELPIFLKMNVNSENINLKSLDRNIRIDRGNGEEKISEDSIQYLEFYDHKGNKRVFISESLANFPNPKNNLIEEVLVGDITLYRDESNSEYLKASGAAAAGAVAASVIAMAAGSGMIFYPTSGGQAQYNYMWLKKKDNTMITVNFEFRDELIEFMNDRKDLHERLRHVNDLDMFINIIKDYNRGYEETQERLKRQHWDKLYGKLKRLEDQIILDTIPAEFSNIKKGQYAIYKSRSGNFYCVIKEVVNSRFAEIQYEREIGNKKEFMVPIKDILIVRNGLMED